VFKISDFPPERKSFPPAFGVLEQTDFVLAAAAALVRSLGWEPQARFRGGRVSVRRGGLSRLGFPPQATHERPYRG
jgi:hypothetical protein